MLDFSKLCKRCGLEKLLKHFELQKKKDKVYTRNVCHSCRNKQKHSLNASLNYKYNISVSDYESLQIQQNHECAICKKNFVEFSKRPSVDHCHETGNIRGLLCSNCNSGLGMFQDDPEILKNAILYLEK